MSLRAKLLACTAAIAISASAAAYAAVDGNALADQYLADGYSYVEVTVGPTVTKVEAIKDGVKTEEIIDNETGAVIKSEQEAADDEEAAKTGKEVKTSDEDPDGDDDDDDDDDHSGSGSGESGGED